MSDNISGDDGDAFDFSRIGGNASDEIKQTLGRPHFLFHSKRERFSVPIFGESIHRQMKVTEITINKKPEEEKKLEAKVVIELEVTEDMLNSGGSVHGGCSAFLVDICSTMALIALGLRETGKVISTVSQSLNLVYHSPAMRGDLLRIINTTLTLGSRAQSARTEIWNATEHRLVASGTHIKMLPSIPKSNL